MRFGRHTTEALIEYFSGRLACEEEYARRMAKLSKLTFPAQEAIMQEAQKRSKAPSTDDLAITQPRLVSNHHYHQYLHPSSL